MGESDVWWLNARMRRSESEGEMYEWGWDGGKVEQEYLYSGGDEGG